jgi:thioredoxin reductase/bacterioferritin-associated ferredoxin
MMHADVAVLGAGPAGMAAGTAAARAGAATVVVDENIAPGGQVYRAPAEGIAAPPGADRRIGDALRQALAASGADLLASCRCWAIAGEPLGSDRPQRFRLDVLSPSVVLTISARALILCPGTHERVVPFRGWTLPGVMGLAAATILLKAEAVPPGRRSIVAGSGPLLAAVSAGILKAGGAVAAVIDIAPKRTWLAALPGLASRPELLARGASWVGLIARHHVPILSGWRITGATGTDELEAVAVESITGKPTRRCIPCDSLLVGHGLTPATEASRLLGAAHRYCAERGGWVPVLDEWQRSSVSKLYVAGDGAGVTGAHAAAISGQIAALAAISDLGIADTGTRVADLRRKLRASLRFSAALSRVWQVPRQLTARIPKSCIVCRCEDITRGEIDSAIEAGACDMNQLKQFTRCGMGPCQGRMCGETVRDLLAERLGNPETVGLFNARLPLRPVPLDRLIGDFCYGDIPIPAPAPI